jgi:hypothetical protein
MFLTHVSPASLLDGSGFKQVNQDWVEIVQRQQACHLLL